MVLKHTKKEYAFYHDKHRRAINPVRWTAPPGALRYKSRGLPYTSTIYESNGKA
jgi:hypothetical protein